MATRGRDLTRFWRDLAIITLWGVIICCLYLCSGPISSCLLKLDLYCHRIQSVKKYLGWYWAGTPSKVMWYTSIFGLNHPQGTLYIISCCVKTRIHIKYPGWVCWVSFICSRCTMVLTKATTVRPYLRGLVWTWWNFIENSGTDSCIFSRSAGTLQA